MLIGLVVCFLNDFFNLDGLGFGSVDLIVGLVNFIEFEIIVEVYV